MEGFGSVWVSISSSHQAIYPVCQFIKGLCFFNQGKPSMIVCIPSPVKKKRSVKSLSEIVFHFELEVDVRFYCSSFVFGTIHISSLYRSVEHLDVKMKFSSVILLNENSSCTTVKKGIGFN